MKPTKILFSSDEYWKYCDTDFYWLVRKVNEIIDFLDEHSEVFEIEITENRIDKPNLKSLEEVLAVITQWKFTDSERIILDSIIEKIKNLYS